MALLINKKDNIFIKYFKYSKFFSDFAIKLQKYNRINNYFNNLLNSK